MISESSTTLSDSMVQIKNKSLVEVIDTRGRLIAYAARHDETCDWSVFCRNFSVRSGASAPNVWILVARIKNLNVPEVVQRKVILAILKELS